MIIHYKFKSYTYVNLIKDLEEFTIIYLHFITNLSPIKLQITLCLIHNIFFCVYFFHK
jgi:hypothetical protein